MAMNNVLQNLKKLPEYTDAAAIAILVIGFAITALYLNFHFHALCYPLIK